MKVVAVMPAYCEGPRIAEAIVGVAKFVPTIVVVDDGSSDDTVARAKEAGAIVLRHAVNRGQGAALKTGTMAALELGADIIVHVDADGQHDPESIPMLIGPIARGEADVVFGSRFLGIASEGMPATRRALLVLARLFNAYVLGIPRNVSDPQSGYRAKNAKAAVAINFQQDRMAHCSEILRLVTRSSLRWTEVPTRVRYTQETLAKGQNGVAPPLAAFKIAWELFIGSFH